MVCIKSSGKSTPLILLLELKIFQLFCNKIDRSSFKVNYFQLNEIIQNEISTDGINRRSNSLSLLLYPRFSFDFSRIDSVDSDPTVPLIKSRSSLTLTGFS